ncbi:MAG TPA: hypothetical protein VJY62_07485 [Bacteroidia bacterium]|nr:hypothetical protein [Bacteroidia bacterium]
MLNTIKNQNQRLKSRFLSGKKLTIIIAALGLLAACNKQSDDLSVPESSQNNSTLRHARPFNATLNAAADANAAPTPCSGVVPFAASDFLLSGTATHTGLMNAQTSRLHHVSCDVNVTTMLLTTNVTVDLVAANGDIIHCTGDDVVNVANLLTGTGTTGTITGTWTITGGTGRFNSASGSVTISGLVDFVTNSFSCECVGTISY